MFQPPKEEKAEDKEQSSLTTLFPGQKRRVSHLFKHGKEVRVCVGIPRGGGQEGEDPLWNQGHEFLWSSPPWVLVEKCLRPMSSSSCVLCSVFGGAWPRVGRVICG